MTATDTATIARRVKRASGGWFLETATEGQMFVAVPTEFDVHAWDALDRKTVTVRRGWNLTREGESAERGQFFPTLRAAAEFVGAWYGRGERKTAPSTCDAR